MTLRKLTWMCAERKRVMGELAAWHLSGVALYMPFVNAKVDPNAINPYRAGPPASAAVQRVKAFIAQVGFEVMAREAAERDKG